jgi:hypothetical protein
MPTEEELAGIFVLFAVRLLIHGISEVGTEAAVRSLN